MSLFLASVLAALAASIVRADDEFPASITEWDALVPSAIPAAMPVSPPTAAARKALAAIASVREKTKVARYQHRTQVRVREGLFAWDCSGMMAWVLARSAPRALATIGRPRPVARDFVRVSRRTPFVRARGGWQRIPRIVDARPGDVFSWERPADWGPGNTGHVGFVAEAPRPIPGVPNAYVVRVIDSTSVAHDNDTRVGTTDGGLGEGDLLFLTDALGAGTHYGWHGLRTRYVVSTHIEIARLVR